MKKSGIANLLIVLLVLAAAQAAQAGIVAAGPINPVNGLPLWFQDSSGTAVQLMPAINPVTGLVDPLSIALPPDPANPFSVQIGFGPAAGAEAFYWSADAVITFGGGGGGGGGGLKARLVMGQEVSFMGDTSAVNGNQFAFGRIRIRFDVPTDGNYTVTTPFGTYQFDHVLAADGIFYTNDNGDLYPYLNNGRLLQSPVQKFLFGANAPAGYLGDPAATSTISGAPSGSNIFRIQGPNGFDISTDQFTVSGQLYTGPTLAVTNNGANLALNGGTLKVSAVGNGPGTTLTINAGTLSAGTVNATVVLQNGGVLSPGNSPGATTINGAYTLSSPGSVLIEIGGLGGPGVLTGNDWIDVNGLATLGGNLDVSILAALSQGDVGSIFTILSYDQLSGTFAGLADGAHLSVANSFGNPYLFDIHYGSGTSDSITLTLTAVPEPATIALLAMGGLALLRRRRTA